MKYLIALLGLFSAVVLAAGTAPHARVLGVAPDPVLIFVACWAMVRGQREAMVLVPLAGLLRDLSTSDPVGTSVLALAPIVPLAAVRELRLVESEFVPALAAVAAASLAYSLISMAVLAATGQSAPLLPALTGVALPSMLVNPLFAAVVYPLMRWLSPKPRSESFGVGSAVQL